MYLPTFLPYIEKIYQWSFSSLAKKRIDASINNIVYDLQPYKFHKYPRTRFNGIIQREFRVYVLMIFNNKLWTVLPTQIC